MYRYGHEEIDAASRVLSSGKWFRYSETGEETESSSFEAEWRDLTKSEYACFTTSGTAALQCACAGLGLGPGDEVIVPGYTWIATALAPLSVGAIPVIVDIDDSLMIDSDAVLAAITPRTKAICAVHMNGLVADLDRLTEIAAQHGLALIEDACQCAGGRWHDGRRVGSIGETGAYSFNYYKVISCGDGGMFTTNSRSVYERALIFHDAGTRFRTHAKDLENEIFCGVNLRGNEILAAVMRAQVHRLDGIVEDLQRNRRRLLERVTADGSLREIAYNGGQSTGISSYAGFRFDTAESANDFCVGFNDRGGPLGSMAYRPIDSDRHIYPKWEPVIRKRGAHTAANDPFQHPSNAAAPHYSENMLPKTLEILATTALVKIDPDWSEADVDAVAAAVLASTHQGETASSPA